MPPRVRALLLETGLWSALRTRPYSRVPASRRPCRTRSSSPRSTRTRMRPDPQVVLAGREADFAAGLAAADATSHAGPVYLCAAAGSRSTPAPGPRAERHEFAGPHPAGLPGLHIHRLHPVHAEQRLAHRLPGRGRDRPPARHRPSRRRTRGRAGRARRCSARGCCARGSAPRIDRAVAAPSWRRANCGCCRARCSTAAAAMRGDRAFLGRYHARSRRCPRAASASSSAGSRRSADKYSVMERGRSARFAAAAAGCR